MHQIVVGVDGSDGAATAIRWAAREAQLHDARLTAVYAWNLVGHVGGAFVPDFDERDAMEALDAWLGDVSLPIAVERTVVPDLPVAALVEASGGADLVVVGSRGRGGFRELLLGSVSSAVAERALCSVAVVRGAGVDSGPVVVGVDRSALGTRALQWAVDEARARRAPLVAVHTWAGSAAPVVGFPVVLPLPHAHEAAEHALSEALVHVDVTGITVRREVVEATPAGALVDLSNSAGLVVVGSRGRGGLTSLLLGSTSRHLLHHASCPVVVVR